MLLCICCSRLTDGRRGELSALYPDPIPTVPHSMPRSLIEAHICGWQAKCWLKTTLAADESVDDARMGGIWTATGQGKDATRRIWQG